METTLKETKVVKHLNMRILDDKHRDLVAGALQSSLYDLIAYSLQVKQAHWNVTGQNFRAVHLQLDEIYADALEAVDSVAERSIAIGTTVNGQLAEVLENTSLAPLPLGFLRDLEVVDLMTERTGKLCSLIREQMAKVEDIDTVTADLLHGVVEEFEKHHWMLEAQRV